METALLALILQFCSPDTLTTGVTQVQCLRGVLGCMVTVGSHKFEKAEHAAYCMAGYSDDKHTKRSFDKCYYSNYRNNHGYGSPKQCPEDRRGK